MSYDLIAAKLDEIEAEMHRIGYWFDNPPTPVSCRFEDIAGEMRRVGYWDAADPNRNDYGRGVSPSFVLHLQKIFLPWAATKGTRDQPAAKYQYRHLGDTPVRLSFYCSCSAAASTIALPI